MPRRTRREFLIAAGAAATAAFGQDIRFPTAPKERIAVASYPFRAYIDEPHNPERDKSKPGVPLKDFAAMVADRFGVHAIEPLNTHFPSTDPAYLATIRAGLERAKSRIVNIPVDLIVSFYDPVETRRQGAVIMTQKWVDVAAAVGCPSLRVHVARARGVKPEIQRAAEKLKEAADYARAKNIVLNLENDDLESEDAFFVVDVIKAVNSPYLHALPDFGNSLLRGDEAFNYRAVTAMFQHAYNIAHAKDGEVYQGKEYKVDMAKTFGIARSSGFRGFYSMEWEGAGEPYAGTRKLIEESVRLM